MKDVEVSSLRAGETEKTAECSRIDSGAARKYDQTRVSACDVQRASSSRNIKKRRMLASICLFVCLFVYPNPRARGQNFFPLGFVPNKRIYSLDSKNSEKQPLHLNHQRCVPTSECTRGREEREDRA